MVFNVPNVKKDIILPQVTPNAPKLRPDHTPHIKKSNLLRNFAHRVHTQTPPDKAHVNWHRLVHTFLKLVPPNRHFVRPAHSAIPKGPPNAPHVRPAHMPKMRGKPPALPHLKAAIFLFPGQQRLFLVRREHSAIPRGPPNVPHVRNTHSLTPLVLQNAKHAPVMAIQHGQDRFNVKHARMSVLTATQHRNVNVHQATI